MKIPKTIEIFLFLEAKLMIKNQSRSEKSTLLE